MSTEWERRLWKAKKPSTHPLLVCVLYIPLPRDALTQGSIPGF